MLNKELLLTPQSKAPIGQFHFYSASSKGFVYWGAFDSEGAHRTGYVWHNYVNSGDAVSGLSGVRSYLDYAFQDFIYKSYPAVVYYKDKQVGIVDEDNKVDIEVAKGFINSAFDKSGAVEYLGFKFDKSDGEALINIMEKYKDD